MRVALFPRYAQALAFRKAHASDPEWAFGAKAEGIGSWIEGQWTLWGDGRSLASKTQRLVACLAVLEDCDDARLSPTWGMASLLVELADEVLGSAEFDEVLRGSMRVDEHREILVEALRAYEAALARAGLVDPGRACALLSAQDDLASAGDEACVYGIEPSAAQKRLLAASFGESVAYRRESPSISLGSLCGAASPGRLHRGLCLRWARACNGETSFRPLQVDCPGSFSPGRLMPGACSSSLGANRLRQGFFRGRLDSRGRVV